MLSGRREGEKLETVFSVRTMPHLTNRELQANYQGSELLPHPPYSPDLAPSDFYLFPNMKKHLRGRVFSSDDDVKSAGNGVFASIDKSLFLVSLQSLEKRWNKCIAISGDYVEK